ncbi:MAG: tyrosine-type recombinase/integrase [Armatimonadota bacterium]
MLTLTITQASNYFLADRRAQNCSPDTITYYQHRLNAFERYLRLHDLGDNLTSLTPPMIRMFLTEETARCSPATAKHAFITLRAFFRFLQADGLLDRSPLETIQPPKAPKKLIQTFTPEQITRLFSTCNASFAGIRDRAMMLLMIDSGLRVSELCTLSVTDIRWEDQTAKLMGKGSVERRVPFGMNTRRALQAYLIRRGILETEALFVTTLGEAIGRRRVEEVMQERGQRAGLTGVRCSPHTFRHTCAVIYLRNGGDAFSLQRLLGHSDLTMTRRYAELAQSDVLEKHRHASPGDFAVPAIPQARRRLR